jgi:hypothetical protein
MGIIAEDEARWLAERLTPQPIATFEQPVRFGAAAPDPELVPRIFIHCIPDLWFLPFADRARFTPGWTLHELATGHDAMLTAPEDVARLLMAAGVPVSRPSRGARSASTAPPTASATRANG